MSLPLSMHVSVAILYPCILMHFTLSRTKPPRTLEFQHLRALGTLPKNMIIGLVRHTYTHYARMQYNYAFLPSLFAVCLFVQGVQTFIHEGFGASQFCGCKSMNGSKADGRTACKASTQAQGGRKDGRKDIQIYIVVYRY